MSKYKYAIDGEPVTLEYRQVKGRKVANIYLCCCDCGLVHEIAYVPLKTRLKIYAWRDNRRTANRRRNKKLKE